MTVHRLRHRQVRPQIPLGVRMRAGRRTRTGTEPVNARSPLRLRMILASVFVPVFAAVTGLLWYWTTQTGPGDSPDQGALRLLTLLCALVTFFAVVDLLVVLRRRRRERVPPGFRTRERGTAGWHD